MRALNIILALVTFSAAGAGAFEYIPEPATPILEEIIYDGWLVEDVSAANGFASDAEGDLFLYAVDEERFAFGSLFKRKYEVLESGVTVQRGFAVAFDRRGYPHYFQEFGSDEPGAYEYAFWDGAKWVKTKGKFPFEEGYIYIASLVISSGDQLHLAFARTEREPASDVERVSFYYGHCRADVWEFEELASVTSTSVSYEQLSLAVDSTDTPHICFCFNAGIDSGLMYATRKDGGWYTETVDPGGRFTSVSLALDSAGRPHVAYCDEWRGDLKYARRETNGWAVETVDAVGWCGPGACLILDNGSVPYVAYYEDGPRFEYPSFYRVKVARRSEMGWRVAPLARLVREHKYLPAGPTALAFDAEGRTHILFEEFVGYVEIKKRAWSRNAAWEASPEERIPQFPKADHAPEIYKWEPGAPLPLPRLSRLLAKPEGGAEVIFESSPADGTEIEVIDAVSLRSPDDGPIYGGEVYETWYKGCVGDSVGWDRAWLGRRDFLVEFAEAYEPLRESPSPEAAAITPEEYIHEQFNKTGLKPAVPAGTWLPLNAALKGWYCVGHHGAGGWLPSAAGGVRLYRRLFGWVSGVVLGSFSLFFPLEGDVTTLVLENEEFLHDSRLSREDPVVTITTAEGDVACFPTYAGSRGAHEGWTDFLTVRLPRPVKRDDITAITLETGVPARRFSITVDPREAWAEYDAQR